MNLIDARRKKTGLRHVKRYLPQGSFDFSHINFQALGVSYTREEAQAMTQRGYTSIPGCLEPLWPSAQGQ